METDSFLSQAMSCSRARRALTKIGAVSESAISWDVLMDPRRWDGPWRRNSPDLEEGLSSLIGCGEVTVGKIMRAVTEEIARRWEGHRLHSEWSLHAEPPRWALAET